MVAVVTFVVDQIVTIVVAVATIVVDQIAKIMIGVATIVVNCDNFDLKEAAHQRAG